MVVRLEESVGAMEFGENGVFYWGAFGGFGEVVGEGGAFLAGKTSDVKFVVFGEVFCTDSLKYCPIKVRSHPISETKKRSREGGGDGLGEEERSREYKDVK